MEISNFTSKLKTGEIKEIQNTDLLSNVKNSSLSNLQEKESLAKIIESTLSQPEKDQELNNHLYSSDILTKIEKDFEPRVVNSKKRKNKFEGFDSQVKRGKLLESEVKEGKT